MRSVVICALASLAAACAPSEVGGAGEETDTAAPPGTSTPVTGDRAHAADGRTAGALEPSHPLEQTCRKGAFCDDFEDATPGSRWTSSVATAGRLDFVGPSSSLGARSLHAVANGP